MARFILTKLPFPALLSLEVRSFGSAGVSDMEPVLGDIPKDGLLLPAGVNVTDPFTPLPFHEDDTDEPLDI